MAAHPHFYIPAFRQYVTILINSVGDVVYKSTVTTMAGVWNFVVVLHMWEPPTLIQALANHVGVTSVGYFVFITDVGYCRWMKRQPRIKLLCNYLLSLYRTYERTSAWRFAGCWLKKVSLLLGSLCVCLLDRSQWSHWVNEWYDGSFYISSCRTWWKTWSLPSNGCLLLSCIVGFT
jgi:hypothetical protein